MNYTNNTPNVVCFLFVNWRQRLAHYLNFRFNHLFARELSTFVTKKKNHVTKYDNEMGEFF